MTREREISKRTVILYNMAHIEYSAIVSYLHTYMRYDIQNEAFDKEILRVVDDECRHFLMLNDILEEDGYPYTSIPVNRNILNDLDNIDDDLMDALFMISLVHEGKGLDASERLIHKVLSMEKSGKSIEAVKCITNEEVSHVAFGIKWFEYLNAEYNRRDGTTVSVQDRYKMMRNKYGVVWRKEHMDMKRREKAGFGSEWFD